MNTNIQELRDNYNTDNLKQLIDSFTTALIWQDDDLDQYANKDLSYSASQQIKLTCRIFYNLVLTNKKAHKQAIDHTMVATGHDLALQMLGHGAGFWEQKITSELDHLLNYCLDKKLIKPFTLYYCNQWDKLEFDFS